MTLRKNPIKSRALNVETSVGLLNFNIWLGVGETTLIWFCLRPFFTKSSHLWRRVLQIHYTGNDRHNLFSSVVTSKNCAYRDSNSDCLSRVRSSAGLSIPGRDTDCMSCSVFICALRSLYSALKSNPLHSLISFCIISSIIINYCISSEIAHQSLLGLPPSCFHPESPIFEGLKENICFL